MNISYYLISYIYINIYVYIYIYKLCVFFVCCNTVVTHKRTGHTGFTFTSSFLAGFTWSLSLVETVYPIVNMIQVNNKEARATYLKAFLILMVKFWQVSNITLYSSHRRSSINKVILKNFAIFIGKHLCCQ